MRTSIVSVSAAVLMIAGGVAAGGEGKMRGAVDSATFVEKAAQDGMTEVELGKLAQQKSSSPDVKAFGARMVKDHGKANAELKAIAEPKDISVPTELDTKHQALVDEMKTKSGAQFDSSYAEHMAADHSKAIELFTEASEGSDAELASFAKKTLPTLKEHKMLADRLSMTTRHASAAEDSSSGTPR